jgi:hypothetical protein
MKILNFFIFFIFIFLILIKQTVNKSCINDEECVNQNEFCYFGQCYNSSMIAY